MSYFLLWYLTVTLLGWLTFPLAYRLLPGLPDRGYAFTRTLGWLVWGYIFWLLASLGVLRNDLGGLLFALLLLLALSAWAWRSLPARELMVWIRAHLRMVLVVELLFLAAFAALALVRAANPNIEATEKPMELAFINAILRSPTFPPHDPWLSGYSISYYYFGYVLVSLLARLAGSPGEIAFNLGIALVYALSALGAYGMVYNLLAKDDERRKTKDERGSISVVRPSSPVVRRPSTAVPLFGPLFIILVSNLEGFLEILHARGLFWRLDPATGERVSTFWTWLGIKDLNLPPVEPLTWLPSRFLWWWRASRVVQDYSLAGNPVEIIDEFPVFSYLLADLHPHVLAMPFAFLAMALALNLFLGGARGRVNRTRLQFRPWTLLGLAALMVLGGLALLWLGVRKPSAGMGLLGLLGFAAGGFVFTRAQSPANDVAGSQRVAIGWPLFLNLPAFLLAAVVLGGLGFLNTWDFPFYVALFAGAYALRQRLGAASESVIETGTGRRAAISMGVGDFLWLGLVLGVTGILAYLPFYLGFSSQAGGILPNLVYPTRGAHLWVMFGSLLLPLVAYLAYLWRSFRAGQEIRRGLSLSLVFLLALWILSLLLGLVITYLPNYGAIFMNNVNLAAPDRLTLLLQAIARRLSSPGGWVTLLALLAITTGLILKGIGDRGVGEEDRVELGTLSPSPPIPNSTIPLSSPHLFSLLLVLLGTLLVAGPEFFFLLDLFGNRMNTIFKFYYQAWLLWGTATAFGTALLLRSLKRLPGVLFSLGLALVLIMGLSYTVLMAWDRTNGFNPPLGWSLDGAAYLELQNPDDFAAARWLRTAPPGVLAEAVGGSYSGYARLSMLSGQPAVLGWDFHEVQWGRSELVPTRKADIERLYCTRSSEEAQAILDRYDVDYVSVGNLERSAYQPGQGSCQSGLNEARLRRDLTLVFEQGSTSIFAVP